MKSMSQASVPLLRRWLRFNAVGAMGICVQLFAVFMLGHMLDVNSLWATALAVEAAVIHNFFWHEHFTWSDRRASQRDGMLRRLLAFNTTTGAVSIAGSSFFVFLFMCELRVPLLVADLFSIAACSLLNFLVNDTIVFRARNSVSVASQEPIFTLLLR